MDVIPAVCIAALACAAAALILAAAALTRLKRLQADREDVRTLHLIRELRRREREGLDAFTLNPESAAEEAAYRAAARDLAAAYEDVCRRYFEEDTEQRWFYGVYGRELIAWAEQGPLREAFHCRRPAYPYTARACRELRKALR